MSYDGPVARLRPGGRNQAIPSRRLRRAIRTTPANPRRIPAPVREWHTLSGAEQHQVWRDLVDWVVWLHDQYELSTDDKLPPCWPQHPGLVEELRTLKALREDAYTPPAATAQAARLWHAELRQILHAVTTVYARACRAGHKPATRTLADDTDQHAAWYDSQPATPPLIVHTRHSQPLPRVLPGGFMAAAFDHGTAIPAAPDIPEFARHAGHWWTADPRTGAWLRVTDAALAATLDDAHARAAHLHPPSDPPASP